MNRRFSLQKQIIMGALRRLDHPAAQDVLKEVQKQYPRISRGTVYRNLNQLSADGVLMKIYFPGSPDRFDTNTTPHNHVRCRRCGRIFDLRPEFAERIDREAERETGFEIERHSISFEGICPRCRAALHRGGGVGLEGGSSAETAHGADKREPGAKPAPDDRAG